MLQPPVTIRRIKHRLVLFMKRRNAWKAIDALWTFFNICKVEPKRGTHFLNFHI